MILCSCNVLSARQVEKAVGEMLDGGSPGTVSRVYQHLGCVERCGRCAPSIKACMDRVNATRGCPRHNEESASPTALSRV